MKRTKMMAATLTMALMALGSTTAAFAAEGEAAATCVPAMEVQLNDEIADMKEIVQMDQVQKDTVELTEVEMPENLLAAKIEAGDAEDGVIQEAKMIKSTPAMSVLE